MGIQVSLYGSLNNHFKQEYKSSECNRRMDYPYLQGLTVRQICDDIALEEKYVSLVIINKTRGKIDTLLTEGDYVELFPRTTGG